MGLFHSIPLMASWIANGMPPMVDPPGKEIHTRDVLQYGNETSIHVMNGMMNGLKMGMDGIAVYGTSGDAGEYQVAREISGLSSSSTQSFAVLNTTERIYITNSGAGPVCIAGTRIVRHHAGKEMTVSGNLGRICGADNYESHISVLPADNETGSACVWVDRYGSNGIRLPGIMFDIGESDQAPNITNIEDVCYPPFIQFLAQKESSFLQSRQLVAPERNTDLDFGSGLVRSNLTASGVATRLCRGQHTKGPDFVSLSEKLYCDMSARHLYPVCEDGVEGRCFDDNQDELVEADGGARWEGMMTRGLKNVTVVKSFKYVENWGI